MIRSLLRIVKYAAVLGGCLLILIFCYDISYTLLHSYFSQQGIDDFDKQLEQVIQRVELAVESSDKLKFDVGGLNKELGNERKAEEKRRSLEQLQKAHAPNPKIIAVREPAQVPLGREPGWDATSIIERSEVRDRVSKSIIPVLVIACNRPTVSQALDKIIASRQNVLSTVARIPVIISQDACTGVGATATTQVIQKYTAEHDDFRFIQHTNTSNPAPNLKPKHWAVGYYKLSRHYKWALNQIFFELFKTEPEKVDAVIIIEDDLEVSPDFFSYMVAGYEYLLQEEAHGHGDEFMCVSAWNDNGKDGNVDLGDTGVMRAFLTDFFPGLGWLMRRNIWDEFHTKWPAAYWDDWVRLPEQRKNRACIRPEISRSYTFGKKGVSNGQFFDKHLKFIHKADKKASVDDWREALKPLEKKPAYNHRLATTLESATLTNPTNLRTQCSGEEAKKHKPRFRLEYKTERDFQSAAKVVGLMTDSKSGVPRTGYLGIVESQYHECRVFISPPIADVRGKYFNGIGYDVKWKGAAIK